MKVNDFKQLVHYAKALGCTTCSDLVKLMGKKPLPTYINGVLSDEEDIKALEHSLRDKQVIAFGKCYNGEIHYTAIND